MAANTDLHVINTQVGGHAGVMSNEDGSLLIKAALPAELDFYQNLSSSAFKPLIPFTPKFYGTLKLEGKVDDGVVKESLVLENLSHTFLKPNILDIKLGTVLYDDKASPEKVERMLKTARETTSLETGVRLTGFQVYDNETGVPVNTPKAYGKSIKPADLPDGIARFFPLASTGKGLPARLLRQVLGDMIEEVEEMREAIAPIEMRMVGGSLLFVYEADHEKAEAGLKALEEAAIRADEAEEAEEAAEEEDDDDDDDDDDGDDDNDEENGKPGPPYLIKLIDFAHTKAAPGQGPDTGVLLGIDTVLSLLRGRLEQIRAAEE